MGKERPGLRWTRPGKGEDEEFMCQLLPDYLQVHSLGAQRKRNPAKKLWLRNRLADYKERYPGRVETWDLKGITEESTKTEREKKYIQRLKDWFNNHKSATASPARSNKRKYIDLIPKKRSRRELAINAYWRLFSTRLGPGLDAAQDLNKSMVKSGDPTALPPGAFRNQHLKMLLALEPDDVKEQVEKSRRAAGGDEEDIGRKLREAVTEDERLEAAQEYQDRIVRVTRTLDAIADTVLDVLPDWSLTVFFGGPEPIRGGGIHCITINRGAVNGSTFDEIYEEFQDAFNGFTRFCEIKTPAGFERHKFTIGTNIGIEQMLGLVKTKQTTANETYETTQDKADAVDNQEDDDQEEEDDEVEENSEKDGREIAEQVHVMDVDAMSGNKEIGSGDPNGNTASQSSSTTSKALGSDQALPRQLSLSPASSHTDLSLSPIAPPPSESSSSESSTPSPIPKKSSSKKLSSGPAVSASTRASSRNLVKALGREDDNPKYWSFDATNHLRKALAGFEVDKLVYWLKELDFALGFPKGNSKAVKLDPAHLPPAVKQWTTSIKEFNRIPSKVTNSSQFLADVICWYQALLPASRRSIWPPPRDAIVDHNEWAPLRKSTSNGVFLLLLSASWLPSLRPPLPIRDIRLLVEELTWALEQMTISLKQAAEPTGTKRKSVGKSKGRAKKLRTE